MDDLRSSTSSSQSLKGNKGLASGKDPPTEDQGKQVRRVMSSQQDIVLTDNDIPQLRNKWREKYTAIFGSILLELPPFREVNHEINLVDPNKRINYRLPKCPEHYCSELSEKIQRYTTAKWWVLVTARQAVPMLCIPKKNGKLRMVFDLHEQNDNTVKDVTPFPDQDNIRHDVARCPYRSKLNMSEVYEQIHIKLTDIPKTAFATMLGTFVSQVMQQGDLLSSHAKNSISKMTNGWM